jgi:dihydrofolate reductase
MDMNSGIGKDNKIPWRLKTDIRRFRTLTMGHHVIMGRKTFLSIGKPLPGRVNIILTSDPKFQADGCLAVNSLTQALELARESNENETFIIGGGEIYSQCLGLTDRIYLTLVHTESEVDVFFPKLNNSEWVTTTTQFSPADEENEYPTTFKILERCAIESKCLDDQKEKQIHQSP